VGSGRAGGGCYVLFYDWVSLVHRFSRLNGSGRVASLTSLEVSELDAGHNWTTTGTRSNPPSGAEFPYRGQGISVPTLAAVLEAFPENLVNIELKQDDAQAGQDLCGLLVEQGARGRVLVVSNYSASIRGFREACPGVATGASRQEVITFYLLARAGLHRLYTPPFDALQIPVAQGSITVVTPGVLAAARDRGVKVHVWTINEQAEMERLFEMGVDGIITDRPDLALGVLGRDFPAGVVPEFVAGRGRDL